MSGFEYGVAKLLRLKGGSFVTKPHSLRKNKIAPVLLALFCFLCKKQRFSSLLFDFLFLHHFPPLINPSILEN
jgi:hypothetical protein